MDTQQEQADSYKMQLTIGKLAEQAEVTVETIRYYQKIRLLEEPEKPSSGYRVYTPDAINRIRFIKRAQQAGFTLKEIADLLSFDGTHCADVRKIAEHKCQQIDTQIKDLTVLRTVLDNLVKRCQADNSTERCSLIDALSTASNGGRDCSQQSSALPPSMEIRSVAIGREPMRPNETNIKS
jgi:MerR family transcriptional regulator, mercuric resistance operon regulatory protein